EFAERLVQRRLGGRAVELRRSRLRCNDQTCCLEPPHLVVHRLSGCAYVPCEVCARPLAFRVKKQERKQSCLESRPEDRQNRQRLRSHGENGSRSCPVSPDKFLR